MTRKQALLIALRAVAIVKEMDPGGAENAGEVTEWESCCDLITGGLKESFAAPVNPISRAKEVRR